MPPFFEDLFDRFQELHADAVQAVKGLPDEALDWTPGPEMNSINVLVVHMTGAERYLIEEVVLGEPTGRIREEEFKTQGLSADELIQRLRAADERAHQALGHLTVSALRVMRTSRHSNQKVSVGWALLHALEHTAVHVVHLQLTRQLWEQRNQ